MLSLKDMDIASLEGKKKMLHKMVEMQFNYRNHFDYEQYLAVPSLSSGGDFVEERNQVPPCLPA